MSEYVVKQVITGDLAFWREWIADRLDWFEKNLKEGEKGQIVASLSDDGEISVRFLAGAHLFTEGEKAIVDDIGDLVPVKPASGVQALLVRKERGS